VKSELLVQMDGVGGDDPEEGAERKNVTIYIFIHREKEIHRYR